MRPKTISNIAIWNTRSISFVVSSTGLGIIGYWKGRVMWASCSQWLMLCSIRNTESYAKPKNIAEMPMGTMSPPSLYDSPLVNLRDR